MPLTQTWHLHSRSHGTGDRARPEHGRCPEERSSQVGRCWGQRFREWFGDFSNVPEGRVGEDQKGQSPVGLGTETGRVRKSGLKALFPQEDARLSSPKASSEGHCGGLRSRDPAPRQSLRAAWCGREREGWVTPGAEQSSGRWSAWLPGPVARRSQSLAAGKPGWECRWEMLGAEASGQEVGWDHRVGGRDETEDRTLEVGRSRQ